MGLKEGTCCSKVRKVLFTVSLTVSHHSETCGMNTTLGVLRRASRKTYNHTDRASTHCSICSEELEVPVKIGDILDNLYPLLSVPYLSTRLLWCLSTDRVQSRQIQAVYWQLLQVVQQGRGQMGAQSRARSPSQEQTRPVRCGLLKSGAGHTTEINDNKLYSTLWCLTSSDTIIQR